MIALNSNVEDRKRKIDFLIRMIIILKPINFKQADLGN